MSNRVKPINILTYRPGDEKNKKTSIRNINDINDCENDHNHKVSKSKQQLEELLKAREIQKSKLENMIKQKNTKNDNYDNYDNYDIVSIDEEQNNERKQYHKKQNSCDQIEYSKINHPKINYPNAPKNDSYVNFETNNIPFNGYGYIYEKIEKHCSYTNIWDAYWPFIGSGDYNPQLIYELDYVSFNGILIEKWNTNLQTPTATFFPIKDILRLNLHTGCDMFDFDFKFENIPATGNSTVININPKSTILPFHLNQFVLIKDPNIAVTEPGVSPSNILAAIGYYNSSEMYLNQFTATTDGFGTTKNLFMSTQLFFIHINQIEKEVNLTISHNTGIGENLFKVHIETNARVEIKEILIPVNVIPLSSGDNPLEITIMQRTIYIDEKYFMTYAHYVNDISNASMIGIVPGYTTDTRQTPLQLATMLLFGAIVPVIDLNTVVATTDHERIFVRLYREILEKNP